MVRRVIAVVMSDGGLAMLLWSVRVIVVAGGEGAGHGICVVGDPGQMAENRCLQ